jgi:hypothetical protein
VVTYHPSAILRADDGQRDELRDILVTDLRTAGDPGALGVVSGHIVRFGDRSG